MKVYEVTEDLYRKMMKQFAGRVFGRHDKKQGKFFIKPVTREARVAIEKQV